MQSQVQGIAGMLSQAANAMESLSDNLRDSFAGVAQQAEKSLSNLERLERQQKRNLGVTKATREESEKDAAATKDKTFHLGQLLGALASGNLGGALGELVQNFPHTESLGPNIRARGQATQAAGTIRGGVPGFGMRAGGGLLSGLGGFLGGRGAMLLTPAAALGAFEASRRINRMQQDLNREGMITGEGRRAGFGATRTALGMAINPFDILSRGDAQQIVSGVRGAGFRGEEMEAISESVGDAINDLGIDVAQGTELAISSIRDAGMTVEEFGVQMRDLDEVAKDTGTSVQQLSAALAANQQALAGFGSQAAQDAGVLQETLSRQFDGTLLARRPELQTHFISGVGRTQIALRAGFRPDQIYSPEFTRQFAQAFTTILVDIARNKPDFLDWEAYVRMFMQDPGMQELFGETPWPAIAQMLQDAWKDTRGGTDMGAATREAERGQRRETAQRRGATIVSQFKTSAMTDDIFGTGKPSSEIADQGELAANRLGQLARDLGLPDAERERILAPIRKTAAEIREGGTSISNLQYVEDLGKQADAARKAIEGANEQMPMKSTISLTPEASRWFRVSNVDYIEWTKGNRGSQGLSGRRNP